MCLSAKPNAAPRTPHLFPGRPRNHPMPFRGPRLPLLLLLLLLPRSLQPGRLADAAPAPAAGLNLSDDFARLHPAYHLAQPRGWLNDPNGLLFFKGVWHVFYQADAALSPIPLRQGWAHAASRDLAHWVRLPFALRPGPEPYDAGGVWTGGATVVDGVPRILYTCVSGPAFSFQQQCAAVPADPGDPLLRAWTKLGPVPTLALPPGGTHSQFRDPTAGLAVAAAAPQQRPRRPRAGRPARSRWLVLVGAQVGCRGAAALYTSPDLQNFSYRGLLYAQPGSASQPLLLGLPCDQYGAAQGGGAMWETPGLFEVRGSGASNASAVVFKYGVQLAGADQFATDYYAAGDLEEQPGACRAAGWTAGRGVCGTHARTPCRKASMPA